MSFYIIYFGKAINAILNDQNDRNKNEIQADNVIISDRTCFEFNNSLGTATIETIKKRFFSTQLSLKYKGCICMLKLYYKRNSNSYHILSNDENQRINEFDYSKLYLIKVKNKCDCEYKGYYQYMILEKLDIITKLKNKEELYYKNLIKINKLKKEDELKDLKDPLPENFYDIIIDVNSIRRLNKDGWKVRFNEEGLKRYEKYKDEKLITIGVIGNFQVGKSFILNKISKSKFLTGSTLYTQGLSVKYPELQENQERKIIFLDSVGLERPILGKKDMDIKNKNIDENNNNNNEDNKNNNNKDEDDIQNKIELSEKNEEEEEINGNKEENKNDKDKNNENEESENIKAFKENSKDKVMTETFLQNFIINVSDILLVVIGELTYSEQLLINKIKEECKKHNKRRIFIIHNLKEFRTVKQVENYINDTLLNCPIFDLNIRNHTPNKNSLNIQNKKKINNEKKNNINNIDNNKKKINIGKNNIIKFEQKDKKNNIENNLIDINIEKDNNINIDNNKKELKKFDIEMNNIIYFEKKSKDISIENNNDGDIIIPNKNIQTKILEEVDIEEEKEINDIKNDINNEDKNNQIDIDKKENLNLKDIYFLETVEYSDKKLEINHLIVTNEDSDAGEYFNQFAYNLIENFYNYSETKKFDIFEQIKNNFKSLFLNNKLNNATFTDYEYIKKNKIIKLNFEGDLDLIFKECHVDELGFSLFKEDYYESKYNYFLRKEENKDILDLRFEIPGNSTITKADYKYRGKYTIINIEGNKGKDILPENIKENIVNKRYFGNYELNIKINTEKFQIYERREIKEPKNGVGSIIFEIKYPEEKKIEKPIEPKDKV